ncbi:hypothetical protein ACFWBF_34125 [Streptomyces sp. NPDC060028]|uniref:hypothetical protein n=1 Tax=Streptomyces sp. NPDC060028 TaxID=3347041 RepID=UPI0036AF661A
MSGPEPRVPPDAQQPPGPTADRREEFARESRDAPRDPEAEEAFLQGRIDMIRGDPGLTEAEKEKAVAALLRSLRSARREHRNGRGQVP